MSNTYENISIDSRRIDRWFFFIMHLTFTEECAVVKYNDSFFITLLIKYLDILFLEEREREKKRKNANYHPAITLVILITFNS